MGCPLLDGECLPDVIKHLYERVFRLPYGDVRRETHAVGVPMQPAADEAILEMNCVAPSYR
jgi:hypothetical protein